MTRHGECDCVLYAECAPCDGCGIDEEGRRCEHCNGHGWHPSVLRKAADEEDES